MANEEGRARQAPAMTEQERQQQLQKKWNECVERIVYSNRYTDDRYVYRHVILPKQLLKMIPKQFFADDDSGCLKLLAEEEWRALGIAQSRGWMHYEVHAPEPHVLLFRREINEPTEVVQEKPPARGRAASKK